MNNCIDELWLVDLDDTLVKKSVMNELLLKLCSPREREQLRRHNQERLANQQSDSGAIYNPSAYLDEPEKTLAYFVEQSAGLSEYIYPDAARFLQRLPAGKAIVFSFGAKSWQRAKFQALESNVPMVVIDHSDKTKELRNSFQEGAYHIGDLIAASVVLVDDRYYSFTGFDELINARGIFLDRSEFAGAHADDHRKSTTLLPYNVSVISSLDQIHI